MDGKAFNKHLLLLGKPYDDIIKYIEEFNKVSKKPIDISFMSEMMSYVDKDECIVPHVLLRTYGVLTSNDDNLSNDVKRILKKYKAGDYLISNVGYQVDGKTYNRIEYYLHPETFKKCLMRSKNSDKYADYYLLLEKSIKYYHKFQLDYKDKLLKEKDKTIGLKDDNIKNLRLVIEDQNKLLVEIRSDSKESKDTIKRCEKLLDDQKYDIDTLLELSTEQAELKEIANVTITNMSGDCINKPTDSNNLEQLVLYNYENKRYVSRGTLSYVKARFRVLTGISYKDRSDKPSNTKYKYITTFMNIPNSRHLYRALEMYSDIGIKIDGNYFTDEVDDDTCIRKIQEVFDNRLTTKIEESERNVVKVKAISTIKKVPLRTIR